MKNLLSYKYINLLARILIGVLSISFIIFKIDQYLSNDTIYPVSYNLLFLFSVFVLMFLNWSTEAFKWKYAISSIHKISFLKSLKITFTAITLGLITPNRIGEIPARAFLLNNKKDLKELIIKTSVSAYSQLLITLLLGTISVYFLSNHINFFISPLFVFIIVFFITVFFIFLFFNTYLLNFFLDKIPYLKNYNLLQGITSYSFSNLIILLFLSLLRYFVFAFQYYFILKAFGLVFSNFQDFMLIPFCFLLTSTIPTLIISELGVRGSVALFVFSIISSNNLAIIYASSLLWGINVVLPAILGLFFINQFTIVSKK